MTTDAAADRYRDAARILHDIAKPMRVLSALAWPGEIRQQFLDGGADRLPEPTYIPVDPAPVLDGVAAARRLLRPGNVVDNCCASTPRHRSNSPSRSTDRSPN